MFKKQRKVGGLQGLSRRQAWELLTPSSVTLTRPFDLSLRYLSPAQLCWLLDTGIYNQLVMLCTLNTLPVLLGLKRRSSLLQKGCWETWGRARGLRVLLAWLGSLRFPGNEAVMAAGEQLWFLVQSSSWFNCSAHTHTHSHSHLLPRGSLFHLLHLCPIHGISKVTPQV